VNHVPDVDDAHEQGPELRAAGHDTPPPSLGLRHLALWVEDTCFDVVVRLYRECMGLALLWQPDADNVYLGSPVPGVATPRPGESGEKMDDAPSMTRPVGDNLALHRRRADVDHVRGALDHLGFCMANASDVAAWERRITEAAARHDVRITQPLKHHRDGSTSFYFRDPAGHLVQVIHIPNVC